jgi:glycosyltransferase involved in cell wall biosynthesis
MRILHVITGLDAGGAEHQLRLLLRHLPAHCPGLRSEVATLTRAGAVARAIGADGTPVHEVGMRGNRDLAALPRLVRLIRAGRFDVVHTHLYRACLYGRLAARLAGVRHVLATEHSLGAGVIEGRPAGPGVRGLYLAAERLGHTTIAVSGTVAQRLVAWGVPRDRIRVIPNGIDAAEYRYDPALRAATRAALGIAPGAAVVGGVGRLVPTKRFDLLIRAVAGLPGVILLLAGEGPLAGELSALAGELGVADRVVFAGAQAHTRGVLCAMDAFASPSVQETFGMAILEALACGLPATYVACPPLEENPAAAGAVPATRVPAEPGALRAALARDLARRPAAAGARGAVPRLVAGYDIAALAGLVGQAYHDVAGRSHRPALRPATAAGRRFPLAEDGS